jgi:hypothetical protein
MELGRLLDAFHGLDLGKNFVQQISLVKQLEGTPGVAFGQHLCKLIADALARDLMDLRRKLPDRGKGCRLDRVFKTRGKPNGAQHAELVFRKAQRWITDGSDAPGFEVLLSTHEVEHLVIYRIEQQTVDGEVAALNVFAWISGEADLVGMTAVRVADVGSKGGDLNGVALTRGTLFFRDRDEDNSELCADCVSLGENAHDIFRDGIGSYVVVGRFTAEEQIAYAAAYEIRLMAMIPEGTNDRNGEFAHLLMIQSDLGACSDLRGRGARATFLSSNLKDMSGRNLFGLSLRL